MQFTNDEMALMCIFDVTDRQRLIQTLTDIQNTLAMEEFLLFDLIGSTRKKLLFLSDEEFAALDLHPDFDWDTNDDYEHED